MISQLKFKSSFPERLNEAEFRSLQRGVAEIIFNKKHRKNLGFRDSTSSSYILTGITLNTWFTP